MSIHPTAIIAKTAKIGVNTIIAPYCVIEDDVIIGDNCILENGVTIKQYTTIGNGNQIGAYTVIGGYPQDIGFYKNKIVSYVEIGNNNVFREHITIHRGDKEGTKTIVGSDNFIMATCHFAHNCVIGDNNIIANYVGCAGYTQIGNHANIGGAAGFHQFVRVGDYAFVGGMSVVLKDIAPFTISSGSPNRLSGLNTIGLRRKGIGSEDRLAIKAAYRQIFLKSNALKANAEAVVSDNKYANMLKDFVLTQSKRGITPAARNVTIDDNEE